MTWMCVHWLVCKIIALELWYIDSKHECPWYYRLCVTQIWQWLWFIKKFIGNATSCWSCFQVLLPFKFINNILSLLTTKITMKSNVTKPQLYSTNGFVSSIFYMRICHVQQSYLDVRNFKLENATHISSYQ